MAEKILRTEYSEEMQRSYMNYSMSVITARAIPDARDGLKPVQRRVLYDMRELHLDHDKPHRKSARIVGDTMGKYHPHGDSSIYETLVVMSQNFKKGMALVDGHGNFGSIEGDGAAAMRYTEARLEKFAEEVYLKDLDKTVNFVPNYDETEKGTGGASRQGPQPVNQRGGGHCRGHEHKHSAPQPGRGDRRGPGVH